MRAPTVSISTQSELLVLGNKVTKPKGTVLFRRGEPAFGVFLITKGRVGLRLGDQEEECSWNRVAGKGSIVGLPASLAAGCYSLTAVTLGESELAFLDRTTLVDLIQTNSSLSLELICLLGDEVLQTRSKLKSASSTTRLVGHRHSARLRRRFGTPSL